jgi:hypothetical protein
LAPLQELVARPRSARRDGRHRLLRSRLLLGRGFVCFLREHGRTRLGDQRKGERCRERALRQVPASLCSRHHVRLALRHLDSPAMS